MVTAIYREFRSHLSLFSRVTLLRCNNMQFPLCFWLHGQVIGKRSDAQQLKLAIIIARAYNYIRRSVYITTGITFCKWLWPHCHIWRVRSCTLSGWSPRNIYRAAVCKLIVAFSIQGTAVSPAITKHKPRVYVSWTPHLFMGSWLYIVSDFSW